MLPDEQQPAVVAHRDDPDRGGPEVDDAVDPRAAVRPVDLVVEDLDPRVRVGDARASGGATVPTSTGPAWIARRAAPRNGSDRRASARGTGRGPRRTRRTTGAVRTSVGAPCTAYRVPVGGPSGPEVGDMRSGRIATSAGACECLAAGVRAPAARVVPRDRLPGRELRRLRHPLGRPPASATPTTRRTRPSSSAPRASTTPTRRRTRCRPRRTSTFHSRDPQHRRPHAARLVDPGHGRRPGRR